MNRGHIDSPEEMLKNGNRVRFAEEPEGGRPPMRNKTCKTCPHFEADSNYCNKPEKELKRFNYLKAAIVAGGVVVAVTLLWLLA